MALFMFIVFGLVVGLVGRALVPERQPMGLIATILLGIAGSFLGGFLGSLVSERRVTDVHTVGILGSVVGAVAVLLITNVVMNRRAYI
jgi:uncharacterized membrane protein YeaQ/YmgE (transglycosylase-associated protein family)